MKTKSKTTAIVLALLLGDAGIHKFYLGQTLQGVLYLIFCWTFIPVILAIVDAIIYISMSDQAFQQKYCGGVVNQQQQMYQQTYQQPYQPQPMQQPYQQQVPQHQMPQQQYIAQGQTSFCPSCGTKIDAGTKFCPSCGSQIV